MVSRARGWRLLAVAVASISFATLVGFSIGNAITRADSAEFWRLLSVDGLEAESFDSLEDLSRSADAVIRGRLTGLQLGRVFVEERDGVPVEELTFAFATAHIAISKTFFPNSEYEPDGISLELFLPSPAVIEQLRVALPSEELLLFLRDKERDDRQNGLSAAAQAADRGYFRLVRSDAYIRNVDGKAVIARVPEIPAYLGDVDGSDFESIIRRVELAQT